MPLWYVAIRVAPLLNMSVVDVMQMDMVWLNRAIVVHNLHAEVMPILAERDEKRRKAREK